MVVTRKLSNRNGLVTVGGVEHQLTPESRRQNVDVYFCIEERS